MDKDNPAPDSSDSADARVELEKAVAHAQQQHGEAATLFGGTLARLQAQPIQGYAKSLAPLLADFRLHQNLAVQWAPIMRQFQAMNLAALTPSLQLAMGHLESHSAMTRSLLAAFADSAGLGLTKNLLDQMRTAQMVASTAAWGSLVTRELSYLQTVDFSGLRSTVAYLSAAVARRLDLAASSPAALRFGRMSAVDAAAFGFRVRGNAGLLTSISGGLRTFGAAELKSGELEPVAFGTLSATGVAGFVGPASAELDVDLSALDLEVHAAGMELIRREQPELVRKLDGALFAIRSGSPDGPSQASHSLQELLDRLLRTVANEREALEWCHEHYRKNGVYVRGDGSQALTRAGKVMFIATRNGIPMEVAEALAKIVTCSSQILQRGKHDDAPARLIANMILVIEGCAGAIIAMSLKRPE